MGNDATATLIDAQPGGNYRVTHTDDPVPKLPPTELGYRHISPEYWITSATDVTPTAADIEVITDVDESAGNEGTSGFDVDAHLWYFNDISAC